MQAVGFEGPPCAQDRSILISELPSAKSPPVRARTHPYPLGDPGGDRLTASRHDDETTARRTYPEGVIGATVFTARLTAK